MAEKKVQKTRAQSDYLSDSKTSEDEVNPQFMYISGRKDIWHNRRIRTGYTGSVITHKSAEQPNGGERTTEKAQNKETFQRAGSRQTYAD